MKKLLSLGLILLLGAAPAGAGELAARAAASRAAVKVFVAELGGTLKGALKAGGPLQAIRVCNVKASGIAAAHSEKNGWSIGRTSLKPRNPANRPDAWEKAVLERFEARKAAGEPVRKMEYYEVVTQGGKRFFRYMKAIPTAQKPCLACHGSRIDPKVAAELDRRYPQDRARGYRAGDIRGAFTITQPM